MFNNQQHDQGCGKWLTTKTTRQIAQNAKNKKARGAKTGRRNPLSFQGDRGPGIIVSSSPMSPRLVQMLSRAKQSRVEQFFMPVDPMEHENQAECENQVTSERDCVTRPSFTTPCPKRHHRLTPENEVLEEGMEKVLHAFSDQDELAVWEDYSYLDIEQNMGDGQLSYDEQQSQIHNISGILPIDGDDAEKIGILGDISASISSPELSTQSSDESMSSPVTKRLITTTAESPLTPSCPFQECLDIKCTNEMDSDSFQYTQWVNNQKKISKDLQNDENNKTYFENSNSTSTTRGKGNSCYDIAVSTSKRKYDQVFTEPESQFCSTEQKAKFRKLQNGHYTSGISSEKYENCLDSNSCLAESSFRYMEWVDKQNNKVKKLYKSLCETDATQAGGKGNDWKESFCIPKTETPEHNDPEKEFDVNTIASLESAPFQYTQWKHNQRQISKQFCVKQETFTVSTDDDFWDLPSEKSEPNAGVVSCSVDNERLVVLASDTDQESDT